MSANLGGKYDDALDLNSFVELHSCFMQQSSVV